MAERFSQNFRLKNGKYTLFNRDRPSEYKYFFSINIYLFYLI